MICLMLLPVTWSLTPDWQPAARWLAACAMAVDGKAVAASLSLPFGLTSGCISTTRHCLQLLMTIMVAATEHTLIIKLSVRAM